MHQPIRRARQREVAIRQQLGLCPFGVRGRRAELKRRFKGNRMKKDDRSTKRGRKTSFNDLTLDLQKRIVSYLPLPEIFKIRLAGLDAGSEEFRKFTKNTMLKRIQSLQQYLENLHTPGDPMNLGITLPNWRLKYTPDEVIRIRSTEFIHTSKPEHNVDGISEMRNTRYLFLEQMRRSRLKSSAPPISKLPLGLGFCTMLKFMFARRQDYVTLPERLLTVQSLEWIDLENCYRLTCLPEDIGTHLLRLRYLNIKGCPLITSLPHSLLRTLNVNLPIGSRLSHVLEYDNEAFPVEDLKKIITKEKYPRLEKALQFELGIEAEKTHPWEVWSEDIERKGLSHLDWEDIFQNPILVSSVSRYPNTVSSVQVFHYQSQ